MEILACFMTSTHYSLSLCEYVYEREVAVMNMRAIYAYTAAARRHESEMQKSHFNHATTFTSKLGTPCLKRNIGLISERASDHPQFSTQNSSAQKPIPYALKTRFHIKFLGEL